MFCYCILTDKDTLVVIKTMQPINSSRKTAYCKDKMRVFVSCDSFSFSFFFFFFFFFLFFVLLNFDGLRIYGSRCYYFRSLDYAHLLYLQRE